MQMTHHPVSNQGAGKVGGMEVGSQQKGRELVIQRIGDLELGQRLPIETSEYSIILLSVEPLCFAYSGISIVEF